MKRRGVAQYVWCRLGMVSTDNDGVSEKDGDARFMLRLPRDLHEKVVARAKVTGRSMNSEIVAMLGEVLRSTSSDAATMREHLAALRAQLRTVEEERHATSRRLDQLTVEAESIRARTHMAEELLNKKIAG